MRSLGESRTAILHSLSQYPMTDAVGLLVY